MASILLVEDEALIRMMVADMLADLGHTVAAEANDVASAMKHASDSAFDMALLDVSLGSCSVEPVAQVLAKRNVPFAFASGYGSDGVPEAYRQRPMLRKPFRIDQLERCITELLGKA
ncbi:response regulator [Bradyrhizobium arachidis]|uniref:Response regulator n=2 Tax=Bradyrhizobium arachidis TaxID=858423 RepID=A0AAE7TED5_9BRAD|nr:response regulator [Bradyrhizobium arachidis]QOZ65962.1 response regulator [Bradyrhizobium arachidis]SFV19909.1 Response regulator receiver domain-containing protein [Bradyrhizobium arachidis]